MKGEHPIGVFDSGVGGTSIWREIRALLPYESTYYLADSANAPYGNRPKEEIIALSIKNTEFLLERNCKLIVVACNTATTNAISVLRERYKVPFIGIEPAIKPAALHSRSRTVGVLATKGTLTSQLFHSTVRDHASGITIVEQVGTGLVPLIEQGMEKSPETRKLLGKYLDPMIKQGIDYLVLGCSHYPYLIPVLKELLPRGVQIIDSGEAVARQTQAVLEHKDLLNKVSQSAFHRFYSNKDKAILHRLVGDMGHVSVEEVIF
ncbi:MAG: glutamate racemase [Flavobacteriaceae bacterium]